MYNNQNFQQTNVSPIDELRNKPYFNQFATSNEFRDTVAKYEIQMVEELKDVYNNWYAIQTGQVKPTQDNDVINELKEMLEKQNKEIEKLKKAKK